MSIVGDVQGDNARTHQAKLERLAPFLLSARAEVGPAKNPHGIVHLHLIGKQTRGQVQTIGASVKLPAGVVRLTE